MPISCLKSSKFAKHEKRVLKNHGKIPGATENTRMKISQGCEERFGKKTQNFKWTIIVGYMSQHPPMGGVKTLRGCLMAPLPIHLAPLGGSRRVDPHPANLLGKDMVVLLFRKYPWDCSLEWAQSHTRCISTTYYYIFTTSAGNYYFHFRWLFGHPAWNWILSLFLKVRSSDIWSKQSFQ